MLSIIMLSLQSGPMLPARPAPPPKPRECAPPEKDGEVVVCAKADQEQFRLRPIESRFEKRKTGPGLEFDLGGGKTANIYSTGETSPDGKPDKRIMVKLKMPF